MGSLQSDDGVSLLFILDVKQFLHRLRDVFDLVEDASQELSGLLIRVELFGMDSLELESKLQ